MNLPFETARNGRTSPGGRGGWQTCDRCRLPFAEGYTWPGLGIPLFLCRECTADIEESVRSYGEEQEAARLRLLDRLRQVGM